MQNNANIELGNLCLSYQIKTMYTVLSL